MIQVINPDVCRMLRPELAAALQSVAQKYGVGIDVGSASYCPENVTFKVIVAVKSVSGEAMTKEAADFKVMCGLYGMKPTGSASVVYLSTAIATSCLAVSLAQVVSPSSPCRWIPTSVSGCLKMASRWLLTEKGDSDTVLRKWD